jgi:signal transduction histidine kinase
MMDERAGPVTVTQRQYLEHALENINKISLIVNTLQEFPSDDVLALEVINVTDLLQTAIHSVRDGNKTLRIASAMPDHAIYTTADRAKLMVAVHTLLDVAVEFSQSAGEVLVQAAQEDDELAVRISARSEDPARSGCPRPQSEVAMPCEILRLHGGVASVDIAREGICYVTFRLPLVGPA